MWTVKTTKGLEIATNLEEVAALTQARELSKQNSGVFFLVIREGATRHSALYRNGALWAC